MAFEFVDLDVDKVTQSRTLQWMSDSIVVRNNTPYPLYINWRTSMIPNTISYEELVPGGMWTVFAANGNNFGFFLDTQGSSIPATGKKCTVTIQANEVIPAFSQANWRSSFSSAFSIIGAGIVQFDINTAGANGLAINIQQTNATDGVIVEIQTSVDGINYQRFRRFRVTNNAILSRVFPVTVDNYRILLTNVNSAQTSNGVFGYSLLNSYSPIPPVYKTFVVSNYLAAFNTGATLTGTTIFGTYTLEEITFFVRGVAILPNDLDMDIRVFSDGVLAGVYHIKMPPAGIANESVTLQLESGTLNLIHRRLNEWGFRIKDQWHGVSDLRVDFTNLDGPGNNYSELRTGYRVRVEA